MAKNLSKTRRIEVEAQAWALSQQCWSQARIARHLGVDVGTICRALARCRRRAIAKLDEDAMLWLVTVLEQLEHAADEAMQAWERSKKPKRKVGKKTVAVGSTGMPGADQTNTELIEREGEPAYLSAYYSAIDRIRALLHLDERTKPKPVVEETSHLTVAAAMAEMEAADAAYEAELAAQASASAEAPKEETPP